jgi:hypothetical protein
MTSPAPALAEGEPTDGAMLIGAVDDAAIDPGAIDAAMLGAIDAFMLGTIDAAMLGAIEAVLDVAPPAAVGAAGELLVPLPPAHAVTTNRPVSASAPDRDNLIQGLLRLVKAIQRSFCALTYQCAGRPRPGHRLTLQTCYVQLTG